MDDCGRYGLASVMSDGPGFHASGMTQWSRERDTPSNLGLSGWKLVAYFLGEALKLPVARSTRRHREEESMDTEIASSSENGAGLGRATTWLLGLPLVATILIATIRSLRHFEADWPTHAEHHLVAFIALAVGISVVGLIIVARPAQQLEMWAWWTLIAIGVSIFGGFWVGQATVGLGHEATVPNTAQAVLTITYGLGLALGRREINRPSVTLPSSQ